MPITYDFSFPHGVIECLKLCLSSFFLFLFIANDHGQNCFISSLNTNSNGADHSGDKRSLISVLNVS